MNTKSMLADKILNSIQLIYLDFDGTITKRDTVNTFFKEFAAPKWIDVEKDWVEGKINSKTCMLMQLDLIKNLTYEKLYEFLNSIEIQDGFREFCTIAKENDKKITIISDGFDLFISYILKKEKIKNVSFYSNHLEIFEKNNFLRFNLTFPNEDKNCALGLGTCKCAKIDKDILNTGNFIYAGDGLSDRCIASKSIMLFAKNSLKNHCLKNGIKFVEFDDFHQIADHLFKEGSIINARVETKEFNRR